MTKLSNQFFALNGPSFRLQRGSPDERCQGNPYQYEKHMPNVLNSVGSSLLETGGSGAQGHNTAADTCCAPSFPNTTTCRFETNFEMTLRATRDAIFFF